MLDNLKLNFDLQNLSFDRIDLAGNDIVAILTDPAGCEYPYSREMLLGENSPPIETLPSVLQTAHKELFLATRETFDDLLLCHDHARWLWGVELEKGVFSFSFHVNPSVQDKEATNFILTDKEVMVILNMLAGPLNKLAQTAPPAIQCAAAVNMDVLKLAIDPQNHSARYGAGRLTSFILQPPRHDLRIV